MSLIIDRSASGGGTCALNHLTDGWLVSELSLCSESRTGVLSMQIFRTVRLQACLLNLMIELLDQGSTMSTMKYSSFCCELYKALPIPQSSTRARASPTVHEDQPIVLMRCANLELRGLCVCTASTFYALCNVRIRPHRSHTRQLASAVHPRLICVYFVVEVPLQGHRITPSLMHSRV